MDFRTLQLDSPSESRKTGADHTGQRGRTMIRYCFARSRIVSR